MAIYGSTNFELVGDFMESMDQDIFLDPEFPDEHTQRLRINLIEEELDELQMAVDNQDMVKSQTHLPIFCTLCTEQVMRLEST